MKKFTTAILTAMLLTAGTAVLAESASQTQTEKALALIGTFASGDTELALSLIHIWFIIFLRF